MIPKIYYSLVKYCILKFYFICANNTLFIFIFFKFIFYSLFFL